MTWQDIDNTHLGDVVYNRIGPNLDLLRQGFAGTSPPANALAYQLWYDTANQVWKQRNAANDGDVEVSARAVLPILLNGALVDLDILRTVPVPFGGEIVGLNIVTDVTTSSDASNYWEFRLQNETQGVELFSPNYDTNGDDFVADAIKTWAPTQFSSINPNDILKLHISATGTPTAVPSCAIGLDVRQRLGA